MLVRFDPFRQMDRFSDSFVGAPRRPLMSMDAYRHGHEYRVRFDLPGVDPASIDVTVDKNVLTVSAERAWTPEEGDQVVVSERPQGQFRRQLSLGESLDQDGIVASYDAGVLTLTIPVIEKAQPRKVEVTAGTAAS